MAQSDDLMGEDPEAEADVYDRLEQALLARLEEFMETEGIDDGDMVDLLIAAVRLRMAAYGARAENPSVAGYKLDLERFRQSVDRAVREARKGAEEFIALAKEARAQLERERDDA